MKTRKNGKLFRTQTIITDTAKYDANDKIQKTIRHRCPENEHATIVLTEKELRQYKEQVDKMKPGKTIQAI